MTSYRTKDGDVLDAVCKAHYGTEAQTPVVLDANPALAGFGPVLPAGVVIYLPEAVSDPARPVLRLWGET